MSATVITQIPSIVRSRGWYCSIILREGLNAASVRGYSGNEQMLADGRARGAGIDRDAARTIYPRGMSAVRYKIVSHINNLDDMAYTRKEHRRWRFA